MIEPNQARLSAGNPCVEPVDSRVHTAPPHPARTRGRCRGERGDVTPMVILTPIAVFLVLWVIQMGLYFHARSVMSAAAQDGTRAAQVENATAGDAVAAANQIMVDSQNLLINETVAVTAGPDTVTVTVTAEINNILPFWGGGEISSTASGPVERFRPEAQR
jgi:hypothetical protein